MKVKLLKDVGVHNVGTVISIDDTIVLQLERSGVLEIVVDGGETETANYAQPVEYQIAENADVKVYTDNSGKVYTTEEVEKMDKRTNIYKEIQANLKK